jgi:hypothetical protein
MNKDTQMYIGAGVILVGGYLLYSNFQKKQAAAASASAAAAAAAAAPAKASFAGLDKNTVVGNRMAGMVGFVESDAVVKDSRFGYNFAGENQMVKDSGFIRSADASIAPNFFDVKDSANSFR